tara:strand:+ start:103 stop:576 length:474 start_codon:yes stop_codon:yes gene_type:complete
MLRPESRGEISLTSADPRDRVRIRQNFLSTERDKQVLRDGFKLVREMAMQKPLDPFRDVEVQPGADVKSDADIDAYIRRTAVTARHPCGTCRMGADEGAVLDEYLCVRGIEALRVIDASSMPGLVGGNINAAVLMIAERGADLIRGLNPLPVEVGAG